MAADGGATEAAEPTRSGVGDLVGLVVIGLFVGILPGGFLHNVLGAWTPLDVREGTLTSLEVEFSSSTSTGSADRSYVLSGTTVGGEQWRIVDEDAYRIAETQGYPQPVRVGVGAWTGNAERVDGDGWAADQQGAANRYGMGALFAGSVLVALVAAFFIGRSRKGWLGSGLFLVGVLGGAVLGNVLFGWIQSG